MYVARCTLVYLCHNEPIFSVTSYKTIGRLIQCFCILPFTNIAFHYTFSGKHFYHPVCWKYEYHHNVLLKVMLVQKLILHSHFEITKTVIEKKPHMPPNDFIVQKAVDFTTQYG